MSSSSKRQTTAAKRNREQAVRERRVRKQEKKDARAAARLAEAAGELPVPLDDEDGRAGESDLEAPVEPGSSGRAPLATETAGSDVGSEPTEAARSTS